MVTAIPTLPPLFAPNPPKNRRGVPPVAPKIPVQDPSPNPRLLGHVPPAPAAAPPAPVVIPPRRAWRGPAPLKSAPTEALENEIVRTHGGAKLVPVGGFDATLEPVVVVHGITDSGSWMWDQVEHLQKQGKQVFMLMYKDEHQNPDVTGQQFARELQKLRQQHYPAGKPLTIVGHSLGGLAVRSALNSLQKPNWLWADTKGKPDPRAGFGEIKFVAFDTPWGGLEGGGWKQLALHLAIKNQGRGESLNNFHDSSKLMTKMDTVDLKGVRFAHLTATRISDPAFAGGPEFLRRALWEASVPRLRDWDTEERAELFRFLIDGTRPDSHKVHNFGRALRRDYRYPELREAMLRHIAPHVRRDLGNDKWEAHLAGRFSRAARKVMPPIKGDHATIIDDYDVLDRVLSEM